MASGSFKTGWGQYTKDYELIVDWSSTSNIATNTSTVKAVVKVYCPYTLDLGARYSNTVTINGVEYSFTSPAIATSGGETFTIATITSDSISHNADGSKSITISVRFRFNATLSGTYYGAQTATAAVNLDNIPRAATITTAPNFNDEENPTITYSNPAGEAVTNLWACISLTGAADDVAYRSISKTGTSYTFALTDAERSMLRYNTLSGSVSRTVYFIVATEIGGIVHKSTAAKTFTVINCHPEITAVVKDVGAASVPLTGDENILIKGFNYAAATMNNTLYKGATIVKQTITNGSSTAEGETGGAASMECGFANVENAAFVFSLTDSRGLTVTQTITKRIIDYVKLTCNLEVTAPTTAGVMTFKASGNYFSGSFGAVDNYLAVEYRIKVNSGDWGAWQLITNAHGISGGKYSVSQELTGLNYLNSYTVQIRAQDRCLLVESAEKKVKTTPVFDWSENDFNFNVPVSINNSPVADFIMEQGGSGGWNYRKWNSGIYECWRVYTESGVNAAATNYSGFYYSGGIYVDFPFPFVDDPTVIVDGGSHSYINFVRVFGATKTAAAFVVVGLADMTSVDIVVHIRAIGRWK